MPLPPPSPPPPPRRPPPRSLTRPATPRPPAWSPAPRAVGGEGEGEGEGAAAPPPPSRLYDPSRPQSYFRQCFRPLARAGGGSHGEVFKVRSREDGRLYAIKRSRHRFRGPRDRRLQLLEVAHHRRVGQHPHCLPLLWGWEQRGRLYLQTHFCPWGSLGDLWGRLGGRRGVEEWRLWGYLWDLLLALRHLHACPIAHLDLKPANVLLTHGGCRLADFGTAVVPAPPHGSPPHGSPPRRCGAGDPRYAAPEALGGQPGPPADIFSLALTILELGGRRRLPPWGEEWGELRRGGLPHGAAAGLSAELREVLGAMMEPDPRRRPTAAEVLTWGAVRRAGRWRGFTRLADVGLRRMEALGEAFRLALRRLWGALWGMLWGQAPWRCPPATPPSCPPPHTPHSTSEEEEEEEEGSRRSPSPMAGLRRALTFEDEEETPPPK